MNVKNKKRIASAIICALMCVPMVNSTASGYLPAPSSIVMTMEADAASKNTKMSGKKKVYVSNLVNPSLTFCINDDSSLNAMYDYFNQMSTATSGFKTSKNFIKIANSTLFGGKIPIIGGNKVLKVFEKIFGFGANVGTKSSKAKKKLADMHKKCPSKGLKVTIRLVGDYKVEYQ